jgi:hypothetical protein
MISFSCFCFYIFASIAPQTRPGNKQSEIILELAGGKLALAPLFKQQKSGCVRIKATTPNPSNFCILINSWLTYIFFYNAK